MADIFELTSSEGRKIDLTKIAQSLVAHQNQQFGPSPRLPTLENSVDHQVCGGNMVQNVHNLLNLMKIGALKLSIIVYDYCWMQFNWVYFQFWTELRFVKHLPHLLNDTDLGSHWPIKSNHTLSHFKRVKIKRN